MDELSIVRELPAAIQRRLKPGGARAVRVNMDVGSAAGIVPESLRFAFRDRQGNAYRQRRTGGHNHPISQSLYWLGHTL
jgi:Zn finger protein HypA/HybF involved in hydrogenase expression